MTETRTYRFKLSEEISSSIYQFAKIHQYDDRINYKEAWKEWLETNDDEVRRETNRLNELGYYGNVQDKMYKSGRYYFRSKSNVQIQPKERRNYVSTSSELIESMDSHIKMHYHTPDYTPALGYEHFCKKYSQELIKEIELLKNNNVTDSKEISCKIKKTYKNRYFQFIRNK